MQGRKYFNLNVRFSPRHLQRLAQDMPQEFETWKMLTGTPLAVVLFVPTAFTALPVAEYSAQ